MWFMFMFKGFSTRDLIVTIFKQHIIPSQLVSSQLTTIIHWPCYYTVHVYVVIHFLTVYVILCVDHHDIN